MALKDFTLKDFRFILFGQLFNTRFESGRKQREAYILLESAIGCFAKCGIENTTMLMVAKNAGVSPSKLKNYFPQKKLLVFDCLKYTRVLYQRYVVEEMQKTNSISEMLSIYFDSCFRWPKYFPNHTSLWMSFLHMCTRNSEYRAINTESVRVGYERLRDLISLGVEKGEFICDRPDQAARFLHHTVTGAILAQNSETDEVLDDELNQLKKYFLNHYLKSDL